jgi:hypothetical protein
MKAHEVVSTVTSERDVTTDDLARAVPKFTQVSDFTTFRAEYLIDDADYVLHFFLSAEFERRTPIEQSRYWLQVFPAVLSDVAESYFQASKPRVTAEYFEEVTSWYMRCRNFAQRLGPDEFIQRFLEVLDEGLERVLRGAQS